MNSNLFVGHTDAKQGVNSVISFFWERYMLALNVFVVSGHLDHSYFRQADVPEKGDLIALHRNVGGSESGIIALSTVIGKAVRDQIGSDTFAAQIPVEPWYVLKAPIGHVEIEAFCGQRLSIAIKPSINRIEWKLANNLFSLFWAKLSAQNQLIQVP